MTKYITVMISVIDEDDILKSDSFVTNMRKISDANANILKKEIHTVLDNFYINLNKKC